MTKIVKIVFDFIFVVVIILLALYFILRVGDRIRIYNVMTGSMENNIHAGDYILILKQDNYVVGDIVTFIENDYYITHRIVEKKGNMLTTKGDANNTIDGTIDQARVVGKVILIGGILNIIINYKFALIGGLFTIYFLSYFFNENKKAQDVKNEETLDEKVIDETSEKVLEEIKDDENEEISEEIEITENKESEDR